MTTNGWDVVYACSGNYVNQQLASDRSCTIESFSYKDKAMKMSGTFGPWELVPGGAGSILQFNCPIEKGSLSISGHSGKFSLDGVVPLVQMQLKFIPGSSPTVSHQLVFNCKVVGSGKGDTTAGAVSVINADTTGKLQKGMFGPVAAALLVKGLGQFLVKNAKEVSYVFASIIPTPTGKNSAWLAPESLTYCYQQPVDRKLGGLAILGLLDGNKNDGSLPLSYDPSLLENYDFGFALSSTAFLKNVLMPSLPEEFGGNCQLSDFKLDGPNTIVQSDSFDLKDVRVGLIDYKPSIQKVKFEIVDTELQCYLYSVTPIKGLPGRAALNSVSSTNQSTFDPTTRTLSFKKDHHMSVTRDSPKSIVETVLGFMPIVGPITEVTVGLVIDAVVLAIENKIEDVIKCKTASSFGAIAPGLVTWNGQSNFKIKAGGLQDNVYMQGVMV